MKKGSLNRFSAVDLQDADTEAETIILCILDAGDVQNVLSSISTKPTEGQVHRYGVNAASHCRIEYDLGL